MEIKKQCSREGETVQGDSTVMVEKIQAFGAGG